jgi:nitrogen-specific signal transduction histidine kinase
LNEEAVGAAFLFKSGRDLKRRLVRTVVHGCTPAAHRGNERAPRKRRSGFVRRLGHELRNPLSPIRNAAYILPQFFI